MESLKFGKSRIDLADIDAVLRQSGFQFSFYAKAFSVWGTVAGWARPTPGLPCFDHLMFFLYGKKHDQISVDTGISLVPTSNTWRGLFESEPLDHESAEEHVIPIRTGQQRAEFLSNVVPQINQAYHSGARRPATELVERSQRARAAASYYAKTLPDSIPDLDVFLEQQLSRATDDERKIAKQFPYWSLISFSFNNEAEELRVVSCYKVVAATIALAARDVKEHGFFQGTEDLDDCPDFAWCVQILASRIHSPELWRDSDTRIGGT